MPATIPPLMPGGNNPNRFIKKMFQESFLNDVFNPPDGTIGLGKILNLPNNATIKRVYAVLKPQAERAIRIAFKLSPQATNEEVYEAVKNRVIQKYTYSGINVYTHPDTNEFGPEDSKQDIQYKKISSSFKKLQKQFAKAWGLPNYQNDQELSEAQEAVMGVFKREYYKLDYNSTDEQLQQAEKAAKRGRRI